MDTIKILGIEEILSQPDPEWLIEGFLQEDSFALLAGPPNSYKSFLAAAWACSVASNVDWLWLPTKHGEVLYIYAEGGTGMAKRLRAWMAKHKRQSLAQFHGIAGAVDMSSEQSVKRLVAKIRAAGFSPKLIIVDTLNRCFGDGDENSTRDMGAFIRGCDKLRTSFAKSTLLVVHHTGWNTLHERGNSSLRGALDTLLRIKERQGTRIPLLVEKQKNFETDDKPLWLELVNVEGTNSAVLELAEPPKGSKPGDENDRKVLAALADVYPKGLRPGELEAASKVNHNTMKGVRKRLEKAEKIEARSDGRTYLVPQEQGE